MIGKDINFYRSIQAIKNRTCGGAVEIFIQFTCQQAPLPVMTTTTVRIKILTSLQMDHSLI